MLVYTVRSTYFTQGYDTCALKQGQQQFHTILQNLKWYTFNLVQSSIILHETQGVAVFRSIIPCAAQTCDCTIAQNSDQVHRGKILSHIWLAKCGVALQLSHFQASDEIIGLFTNQGVGKNCSRQAVDIEGQEKPKQKIQQTTYRRAKHIEIQYAGVENISFFSSYVIFKVFSRYCIKSRS